MELQAREHRQPHPAVTRPGTKRRGVPFFAPSIMRSMPAEETGNVLPGTVLRHAEAPENNPATAPPMTCPVPVNSVADYLLQIPFAKGGSSISGTDKLILADFATEWNLSATKPVIRIDGFASMEGSPAQNWPLSCARASAVATELHSPSVGGRPGVPAGKIDFFANGETDRFSSALPGNRTAGIHAPGMPLPSSREPSVHSWTVSNTGTTNGNNACAMCPVNLGVNSDPPKYKNGIEFTAAIRDHNPAFSYDIKRTKETKYHRKADWPLGLSGPWETVSAWNKPAGSDDDSHNSDEHLVPVPAGSVHNIFSFDAPGFNALSGRYNAYLQKINFIEFVRVRRPDGSTYDSALKQRWHTLLLVEKTGGTWAVNTADSEIGPGHLASLNP